MKQDPILPSIHVLDMSIPSPRMIPSLTKIGYGQFVGDGFIAFVLHILCLLIAIWCMDIPKHDNPLHSTIEVAFEAPEALPIPEEISTLPDLPQNELQTPDLNSFTKPESLPKTDIIETLPMAKPQHLPKEENYTHSQPSEHVGKTKAVRSDLPQITKQITGTSYSVKSMNKNLTAAQRCSSVPTDYPMAARRRHEEGIVKIGYQLLPNGQVQQVEVIESSGFSDLDHAAISAVQTIKCQAALGQPVIKTSVPVKFSLNKNN